MGKNKKGGPKANVFKVAGAKSLKKSKTKAVNLGLKNLKQKVHDIDAQFVELNKNPKPDSSNKALNNQQGTKAPKVVKNKATKEDIAKTTEQIVKMDLCL